MAKKEEKLTKEEESISKEVMEEVKKEIKEETPEKIKKSAHRKAIYSIALGIIGIIVPVPINILVGFGALILPGML